MPRPSKAKSARRANLPAARSQSDAIPSTTEDVIPANAKDATPDSAEDAVPDSAGLTDDLATPLESDQEAADPDFPEQFDFPFQNCLHTLVWILGEGKVS